MATATLKKDGRFIDYTPGSAVAAGDIVELGTDAAAIIGVAPNAIAAGELGALDTEGLYLFPKDTSTAHAIGALLYWDGTSEVTETATDNPIVGRVVAAAGSSDPTVLVKLGRG